MSLFRKIKIQTRDKIKEQIIPICVGFIMLVAAYVASLTIPANWFTYLAIVPPSVVVLITALARLNDIKPDQKGKRWHVRRAGLILAGIGAMSFIGSPWAHSPLFPSWKAVMLMYGLALAWLTTPNMPPWWKYITGEFRVKGEGSD